MTSNVKTRYFGLFFVMFLLLFALFPSAVKAADTSSGAYYLQSTQVLIPDLQGGSSGTDVMQYFEADVRNADSGTSPISSSGGLDQVHTALFTINNGTNVATFDPIFFAELPPAQQQSVMQTFIREIQADTHFSAQTKNQIYDTIRQNSSQASAVMIPLLFENTNANLMRALQIFQPFQGLVGTIMGCIVLGIVLGVVFFMAIDIIYIALPIFRKHLDAKSEEKTGSSMERPTIVSYAAFSSVRDTEASDSGNKKWKSALLMYFGRQVITLVVLSILILYLLCGQIAGLIGILLNLVSGFKIPGSN